MADPTPQNTQATFILTALRGAHISTDTGYVIKRADLLVVPLATRNQLEPWVGKTVGEMIASLNKGELVLGGPIGTPLTAVAGVVGDVFSTDWGALFSYAAALLLLVAGLWLYTRGQPQRLQVVQA